MMKPGTIIITTCSDIPVFCHHVGVVSVDGQVWNNTPAKKNRDGGNVVKQPIGEFMAGRRVIEAVSSEIDLGRLERYAESNSKRKWHPLDYNCEDFVEEAVNGKKFSLLKNTWVILLIIIAIYGSQGKK